MTLNYVMVIYHTFRAINNENIGKLIMELNNGKLLDDFKFKFMT